MDSILGAWIRKTVHWMETFTEKEKLSGTVVSKKGFADNLQEDEKAHHYWFPWKKFNCKQWFQLLGSLGNISCIYWMTRISHLFRELSIVFCQTFHCSRPQLNPKKYENTFLFKLQSLAHCWEVGENCLKKYAFSSTTQCESQLLEKELQLYNIVRCKQHLFA